MAEEIRATRAKSRSTAATAYLTAWGVVACCGLAYVGIAVTRPDLIGSVLPLAETAGEPSYASRAMADMSDEITTLRKWVDDMQHDLAQARSALQEQTAQQAALLKRVAAAEEQLAAAPREAKAEASQQRVPGARVPRVAQAQAAQAQAAQAQAAAQAASAAQNPAANVAASQQPSFASNVRVLNPSASAPITTGSIASAAPAAPKVNASPAGAPRGIEIATAESLEGLRAKWGDIAGRNTDALADAAPRYKLATDGRATPFTLVAGPYGSPADATRACAQLKARGVACRVGEYGGSAF